MKKILLGIIVFMCLITVNAKDYQPLDLIPIETEGHVTTDNYFYHGIYYDTNESTSLMSNDTIKFDRIKNLDNEERYISVSIGFFDSNKDNIGIYNYCSSKDNKVKLKQSEEKPLTLTINDDYLSEGKTLKDVKYITVMSDNPNCNSGYNYDLVGRKAGYIEYKDPEKYDYGYIKYYLYVLILIVVILLIKFVFDMTINKNSRITNRILGVSEKDLRSNEEIKKEYFERMEIEKQKRKKPEKKRDIKDISQEDGNTDLHNMYK